MLFLMQMWYYLDMNIRKIIKNLFNFNPRREETGVYNYVSKDVIKSVKNDPQKSRTISKFVSKTYSRYNDELSELSRN